jgi:hypothetical protein
MECPERVENTIFAQIENEAPRSELRGILAKANERQSFFSMFKQQIATHPGFRFRFASFVSVAVLIIVLGLLSDRQEESMEKAEFTAEEIETATKNVELALSYVGFYAKKTESVLVDQMVSEPIVKPLKSSIKKAFQPLMNGDKS